MYYNEKKAFHGGLQNEVVTSATDSAATTNSQPPPNSGNVRAVPQWLASIATFKLKDNGNGEGAQLEINGVTIALAGLVPASQLSFSGESAFTAKKRPIGYGTMVCPCVQTCYLRRTSIMNDGNQTAVAFSPSSYIEDYETVTNTLHVGIADMVIAAAFAAGHGDDYLPGHIEFLNAWNSSAWHPFIEQYATIHGFPNLATAAEKVLHDNGLGDKSPWEIAMETIFQKDCWASCFRRSHYPAVSWNPWMPSALFALPGEQGGILEQFCWFQNGPFAVTIPISGIYPAGGIDGQLVSRFTALPWERQPLFGLDELHHSGKKLVLLTPSMTEAFRNRGNQDAAVASWVGGPAAFGKVDIEPLKGHTVVYVLNPNTFFTPQEAVDCLEIVVERLQKVEEINLKVAIVEEVPGQSRDASTAPERLQTAYAGLTCNS